MRASSIRSLCAAALALGATAFGATDASAQQTRILQFNCDLSGMIGVMTLKATLFSNAGVTWGPGPNPDITGVIGTGDYTIVYEGEVRSPTSRYIFRGENAFADFTELGTYERFRVRFDAMPNGGLLLTINPFGRGPAQHYCQPVR